MPTLLVSKVIGSVTTSVFTAVLLMGELAIFKKFAQISTLPEFFFRFTFTCMIVIHLVCNLGLYTKLVTWQQVGETIYYAICVLYEVIQAFYLYACLYRFVGDKKTGLSVISLRNLILLRNCILTIVLLDVLAIGIFVYARFSGLNREFVLTLNGIATALPNVHTILLVVTFNAVYHIALPETSSGSQSTSSLSRLRTNPKSESHIKSMHAPTSVYLD
ncbi:hypothetical protein EDD86DRAFT_258683 [Gorgonomyces haynaldii]|nr:hypothetical protein EDD86DRAFT_258683 [Gorgonomyces haynaldii]